MICTRSFRPEPCLALHCQSRDGLTEDQQTASTRAPQMLFFRAATGNAFTTVRAGFAFTITTLPKTSLLPALVAGFVRVLIMQKPGKVNLPLDLTSLAAMSAKLATILPATVCLSSNSSAMLLAIAPLVMTLMAPPFIAFIGVGAMMLQEGAAKDGRKYASKEPELKL